MVEATALTVASKWALKVSLARYSPNISAQTPRVLQLFLVIVVAHGCAVTVGVSRQVTAFAPYGYGSGVQAVGQCKRHCAPPPRRLAQRMPHHDYSGAVFRQVTANLSMYLASPTPAATLGAAREEGHLTAMNAALPEKRKVGSSTLPLTTDRTLVKMSC